VRDEAVPRQLSALTTRGSHAATCTLCTLHTSADFLLRNASVTPRHTRRRKHYRQHGKQTGGPPARQCRQIALMARTAMESRGSGGYGREGADTAGLGRTFPIDGCAFCAAAPQPLVVHWVWQQFARFRSSPLTPRGDRPPPRIPPASTARALDISGTMRFTQRSRGPLRNRSPVGMALAAGPPATGEGFKSF
jgi:hypothetical protein